MAKNKTKKKKLKTGYEAYSATRNFWTLNPVTRIVPNRKRYTRKRKHKNDTVIEAELMALEIIE